MAHLLPYTATMTVNTTTKTARRTAAAEPSCILRWVFQRGPETLTCAVGRGNPLSYDVCVLPHWNLSDSTVERFDAPASALRRHAEIASRLRQAGWVASYGADQRDAARQIEW
jgi:hypothetical protein